MSLYKTDHFKIHELVYPELYELAVKSRKVGLLWQFMDQELLIAIDRIREFINTSTTINDYAWGGRFKESGLRNHFTKTGATMSAHKSGKACDLKFSGNGWTPERLREYMKKIGCFEPGFKNRKDEEAKPFVLINRIEWMIHKEMTWFHVDRSPYCNSDGSIGIIYG